MTNYDPKNYYYDALYDRLWPKKFLIWSTMTHYDPIFFLIWSTMAHYEPKKFILWSTMTHYDPKNFYYDPLYDT